MAEVAELFSGLGIASALLQAHLGVGIVLGAFGIGVASDAEFRKALAGVPWESTLRAAARAAGPIPLLAAFALAQAAGAIRDTFTTVGLLAAGGATLLATLLASLDLGLPRASRALSAVAAFGHALLVVAAWPSGAQLLCASILMRAAIGVQAASAMTRALAVAAGPTTEVLADLELVAGVTPALVALSLIDLQIWGEGSMAILPTQPAIYVHALLALVAVAHMGLQARIVGSELDFKLKADGGRVLEPVRFMLSTLVHVSMAAALGRVLVGTFRLEVSTSGFAIEWGEPIKAASVKLLVLVLGTYIVELLARASKGEAALEEADAASPTINGLEMSPSADGAGLGRSKVLPAMHYFKALVAPAKVLLLAMVAARMSTPAPVQDDDDSSFAFLTALLTTPFRYGFALAGGGVGLQVIALLAFTITGGVAGGKEPPVDTTGTLMWQPQGILAQKVASTVRFMTLLMLEGGLLLGCAGLNPVVFAMQGLVVAAAWFVASSNEARAKATTVMTVGALATFSFVGEFLERRRLAQEAAAARRAAAVAKDLVEETKKPAAAAAAGPKGSKALSKQGAAAGEKKDAKRKHR